MFMRGRTTLLLALFFLLATVPSLEAQALPMGLRLDSSLRAEFLFGRQVLRNTDPAYPTITGAARPDLWRIEFGPRVPVLEGTFELSPFGPLSARFAGSASVLETTMGLSQTNGFVESPPTVSFAVWDVKPEQRSWEVAGLYHVFQGLGHRYSITAGFRQEVWRYRGKGVRDDSSFLRDEFTSNIPFIGLQAAMFLPFWKARFEVLGSPFMNQQVVHHVGLGTFELEYRGKATGAGLIELRAEGTVGITPNCWLGIFGRYTYQELYGRAEATSNGTFTLLNRSHDFFVGQSFGTIGLNGTLVF